MVHGVYPSSGGGWESSAAGSGASSSRFQWLRSAIVGARLVVDDRQRAAWLPSAAQRLVEGDQALRDASLRRHETLLLAEQRALRVEHPLEVDEPFAVLHVGDVEGAARRLHRFLEDRDLRATLREIDGCVLQLPGRAKHGVLVLLEELLEARVLHAHLIR